ncbi:hypothetical protein D5Q25_12985 [Salmonella enterica subsp. enterica serovar Chester]|nr:hypothetical protein [Salmonella enterica subsp. enterica serovar Chester]
MKQFDGLQSLQQPLSGLPQWVSERILQQINQLEKYELVRIDRNGFTSQVQAPYLTTTDILQARKACGLMSRCSYREVSNIVLSRSRL